MKRALQYLILLVCASALAQVPAPGTVQQVTVSNVTTLSTSPAGQLLGTIGMSPSQLINNVMANFAWRMTVNGVTSNCLSASGILDGAQTWNCVVLGSAVAGPTPVQFGFANDTGSSTATIVLKQASIAGNTLVVLALGNPNGSPPPVPTATGVTFVECTACAATSGDRYQGRAYYALAAASVTAVRFSGIGSAYGFAAYELTGVTGLDSGATLSSGYAQTCSAAAAIKTAHTNALIVTGLVNMDTASLSGETAAWQTDGAPFTDNNNTTFAHTSQAAAGPAALSDKFPTCVYGRPTITVAAFY